MPTNKRCLMIAFHYPPCQTSSGYLRSEKFVRYLPESGWQPEVLTARVAAYGDGSKDATPSGSVHRAFAFDAQRLLSWRGKYLACLTLPDRWWSWWPAAVWRGWRLFRQRGYQVIWSTYPTPTALLVGYGLKRLTGRPWVVDLRDPMIDDIHPVGRLKRWVYSKIEALVAARANRVVVTTPGARELYLRRYPGLVAERIHCIGNGFDEADFANLTAPPSNAGAAAPIKLVHSGTLYPLERNPVPFLNALAGLKRSGCLSRHPFEVVLRASGHDAWLKGLIAERELQSWVRLAPAVSYREALQEMIEADGLLIFQADNCQAQIPAKLYEYLRSGRPVFGLVDEAGDTAALLRESGVSMQVNLADEHAITVSWASFIKQLSSGNLTGPDPAWVAGLSRQQRAADLAALFDDVVEAANDN